jgi:hypothetical protein
MAAPSVFQILAAVFREARVRGVLIGGYAVNYYKVTRQTADIDFLMSREDFQRVITPLEARGYSLTEEQEIFARFRGAPALLMDVDFMFIGNDTMDTILEQSVPVTIAGEQFRVPSLYHLIALKLHAIKYNPRHRELSDLPDIVNLIRQGGIDARSAEFKALCLKYGSREIYTKIESYL